MDVELNTLYNGDTMKNLLNLLGLLNLLLTQPGNLRLSEVVAF